MCRWQSADSGYGREAEARQPGAGGQSPNVCAGRADGRGARWARSPHCQSRQQKNTGHKVDPRGLGKFMGVGE